MEKAQADFAQAATVKPEDVYVAIWLDFAERRNGAAGHLQEATKKLDMTRWPAPAVRMLLGEQTLAATIAEAEDPDAIKKRGNLCETNMFSAELSRLQGHSDEALRLYRLAASDCPENSYEFVAANAALRELSP
ncbi:hypothetical protein NKH75_07355 [Mesorhizobium sp. M0984]